MDPRESRGHALSIGVIEHAVLGLLQDERQRCRVARKMACIRRLDDASSVDTRM